MGRVPCCDKANVKKGPWSPEEDAKLKTYIINHGIGGNWIALPQKIGLKRCGKSCRLRWLNYLRPNIKHGGFSEAEDNIICNLYLSIGSRWSVIAAQLPGRTDNDVKNYWNTKLKKKLLGRRKQQQCNSALERLQLHVQLQSVQNPLSDYYNDAALWPEIHHLQEKDVRNGVMQPVIVNNTGGFCCQAARRFDNLVADGNGGGHAPPQKGQMAEPDSFNDGMIWWSDGFDDAKSSASGSSYWGSTSVVQFNEMFQDYESGYNV